MIETKIVDLKQKKEKAWDAYMKSIPEAAKTKDMQIMIDKHDEYVRARSEYHEALAK